MKKMMILYISVMGVFSAQISFANNCPDNNVLSNLIIEAHTKENQANDQYEEALDYNRSSLYLRRALFGKSSEDKALEEAEKERIAIVSLGRKCGIKYKKCRSLISKFGKLSTSSCKLK